MIGDPLKKVTTGQPFVPSAASWNAFADAARAHLEKQVSNYKPYLSVGGNGQTLALVQNTGSGVGRFRILSITGTVFDPTATATLPDFQNCIALVCGTFDATKPFVITLEPIAANAWGMVVVAGAVPCQVSMQAQTDQFADVNSVGNLQSGASGSVQILWAATPASYPSTVWAIVRFGSSGNSSLAASVVSVFAGGVTANPVAADGTIDTSKTLTLLCRATNVSGTWNTGALEPNLAVDEQIEYQATAGLSVVINGTSTKIDGWISGDVLLPRLDTTGAALVQADARMMLQLKWDAANSCLQTAWDWARLRGSVS